MILFVNISAKLHINRCVGMLVEKTWMTIWTYYRKIWKYNLENGIENIQFIWRSIVWQKHTHHKNATRRITLQ